MKTHSPLVIKGKNEMLWFRVGFLSSSLGECFLLYHYNRSGSGALALSHYNRVKVMYAAEKPKANETRENVEVSTINICSRGRSLSTLSHLSRSTANSTVNRSKKVCNGKDKGCKLFLYLSTNSVRCFFITGRQANV